MKKIRSSLQACAAGLLAMAGLAAAPVAKADRVYWSVGVQAAPGVSVGVGNVRPVISAPVYVAPQPVYVQPAPLYAQPAVIYRPAPVLVAPAPVYYGPPVWRRGHYRHGHAVYYRY